MYLDNAETHYTLCSRSLLWGLAYWMFVGQAKISCAWCHLSASACLGGYCHFSGGWTGVLIYVPPCCHHISWRRVRHWRLWWCCQWAEGVSRAVSVRQQRACHRRCLSAGGSREVTPRTSACQPAPEQRGHSSNCLSCRHCAWQPCVGGMTPLPCSAGAHCPHCSADWVLSQGSAKPQGAGWWADAHCCHCLIPCGTAGGAAVGLGVWLASGQGY